MMPVPRTPESVRRSKQENTRLAQYQFPSNLGDVGMLLFFKDYSYGEREVGAAGGVTSYTTASSNMKSSIYLPLPDQLLDSTTVKVGPTELGMAGAGAASAVNAAGGGLSALEKALNGLDIETIAGAAAVSLFKEGVSKVAPNVQKGIEAGAGAIMNPFQALVFDGVDLKTYAWNWTFSPKSINETNTLKSIIKQIKYHIHPYYKELNIAVKAGGRAFLSYPSVCVPLITGVQTLVMKPCMISQFQVDYGAGGELAFLQGGEPAVVRISMTLSEMQIWTREDYGGESVVERRTSGPDISSLGSNLQL